MCEYCIDCQKLIKKCKLKNCNTRGLHYLCRACAIKEFQQLSNRSLKTNEKY